MRMYPSKGVSKLQALKKKVCTIPLSPPPSCQAHGIIVYIEVHRWAGMHSFWSAAETLLTSLQSQCPRKHALLQSILRAAEIWLSQVTSLCLLNCALKGSSTCTEYTFVHYKWEHTISIVAKVSIKTYAKFGRLISRATPKARTQMEGTWLSPVSLSLATPWRWITNFDQLTYG